MTKARIGILALFLAGVLIGCTDNGHENRVEISSAATLPTPQAAITVDGKAEDWASVPTVVMNDCSCAPWKSTGLGMKSIKLAHDDQNLYVLTVGMGIKEKLDRFLIALTKEVSKMSSPSKRPLESTPPKINFSLMFKTEGSIYRASYSVGYGWRWVGKKDKDGNWKQPPTAHTSFGGNLVQLDPEVLSEWTRAKRSWFRRGINEEGLEFGETHFASFGRPWVWEKGAPVAKWNSREDPGFIAAESYII